MNPKSAQSEQPPRAGRSEPFPSGRLTFSSPNPLPTGLPPVDHGHAVGNVSDGYLDFGTGATSVFGWQSTLGYRFFAFCLLLLVFRLSYPGLRSLTVENWRLQSKYFRKCLIMGSR